MSLLHEARFEELQFITRRHFLRQCGSGMGAMALASLFGCGTGMDGPVADISGLAPHFPPRVKHVIFLHMAGAPSQLELFDYKPELQKLHNQPCPDSLLEGKRFAFIEGVPNMLGP
ncbi:MAG TPA: DUF1501 domain-containing protein, partial [Longimicrobiaceae bacterium]